MARLYACLGWLLAVAVATLAPAAAQDERSVHSPPHTVALLELYTSEG
jgi:hypothetical protein